VTYCLALRLDEGLIFLADTRTNAGVDNITTSVNEQKQSSMEIARNVENIASMAEGNNSAVQRTVDAVQDMERLAAALKSSVGRFKV